DAHAPVAPYEKYKHWCDEYFYLRHRGEMRGIGGIFYDYLDSADWEADFAFTQQVGRAFGRIYPELVRKNFTTPWSAAEREEQLEREHLCVHHAGEPEGRELGEPDADGDDGVGRDHGGAFEARRHQQREQDDAGTDGAARERPPAEGRRG